MARFKRTLEEVANKSDSDDDDYDDRAARSARHTASKSKSKKTKQPAKKRRRHDSDDDDIVSDDDDLLSEDDDFLQDSEFEDENAERNARGTVRRRAATNIPIYNDGDSSNVEEEPSNDDDGDELREDVSPRKRQSTVIKLKIGHGLGRQPPASSPSEAARPGRRMTRRTRDPSAEIYALTNSGRHVQTVEGGTHSPETHANRRLGRGSRDIKTTIAETETEEVQTNLDEEQAMEITTEIKASQLEILESAQGSFDDSGVIAEMNKLDADMLDPAGFIPESENGDVKEDAEEEEEDDDDDDDEAPISRRRGRATRNQLDAEEAEEAGEQEIEKPDGEEVEEEEGEDGVSRLRRSSRKQPPKSSQRKGKDDEDFEPEEEESNDDDLSVSDKSNASPRKDSHSRDEEEDSTSGRRPGLRKRKSQSRGQSEARVDIADELAEELEDLRSDRPRRRVQPEIIYEKPRRSRKDVDYRILRPDLMFPIEEAENEVAESPSRRGRGGGGGGGVWQRTLFPTSGPFGGGGPAAILAPPGAHMTTGGVDSDSSDDEGMQHPKAHGAGLVSGPGLSVAGQTHNADPVQGLSGTPANLGKIKDRQALADADPLGVDMNVNFDSVGGLQGHIDQLKEMVSLPLLYPEIFQRFHIVPPRGVLFHGPPGTGKTLLARALANSVSSEGRKVTFYMRKGADALSKWVGEAERQLRLLFEEARKTQPSIIFFDEIDGLAPVRSSKQEQIHASIVSTLLALMDGMDGRGQVIVIGATNRPDSIDPALRRPGRFDREFYFSLPNTEARRAILDIHTKGWDPPLPGEIKDELAEITKGYGGADLRALCTEAALNAVQRRYPQIYKSDKKLLIDPKMIHVTPKDFMLAIKKMVPSSERATSSGASPLPSSVEPLLRGPLVEIERQLSEILPRRKRLTALEEAQYEEPEGHGGSFKHERMQQDFERSRVFRPRMLIEGQQGMGQQYLAAALLHHFEGLHVQAFDLPTLLSDSTRSPEATVIQLFAEVKRHKPSVIYIPNIHTWFETVGPAVISTFMGLLRSVPPTDPVLLLGVLESTDEDTDTGFIKSLFGYSKRNVYGLKSPDGTARHAFFAKLIEYIKTSPVDFPDPDNRKKRQLEALEVAPPPATKPTTLTKEQLKAQKRKDRQTLNLLKIRIQPIMDQIKKYKRFRTGVVDESQIRYLWDDEDPNIVTSDLPIEQRTTFRPFEKAYDKHGVLGLRETVSGKFYYNMEIVTIEKRLSNGWYKRPSDFLADIKRLAKDAKQTGDQERILRANELLSNVEVDITTIEQTEPALVAECENVYLRELEREKALAERTKPADDDDNNTVGAPAGGGNVPHGNTESAVTSGPVVLGESFPARPVTPSRDRPSQSLQANGYYHGPGGGSDLNDLSTHVATSNGSHADGEGDTYMANSEDISGLRDTQNDSFGPSAQPKPAYSHTAPSQQIRRESGISNLSQKGPMTPMAPGSQPNDYTNEASTTQTTSDKKSSENSTLHFHTQSPVAGHGLRNEFPDLTQYPDRVSQEEHLPDTQQGGSSQPSPKLRDFHHTELPYSQSSTAPNGGGGSQSQARPQSQPQPPVPLFDAHSTHASHLPANLQPLLNDDEDDDEGSLPEHKLVVDAQYIEDLHEQLTRRTSGCTVEQLEQINTSLMDYIWQMRSEWNRTSVASGVIDTFNEVFEDMLSIQEVGPISQQTQEQLRRANVPMHSLLESR
ncbi:hypothetical protein ASPZODRAFT_67553 [Penicilliopsis zonata CBS 506.65]|uniref:AAA+ ATPase domain-containing protein n=1 Tax=Penicilliopsis zonata CBS 506.65 TaxID=1073090 RepID=A0A1L9SGK0_9EURO|nr:hypothetical protein ASPZODRAFT_67553 [Penicilliopsis zonata CBS 506.65]OJJ46286.1 hypothetical protein ASPZODRAFT_67553 [Penicilliopsis zonata CBS 506.65]